MPLQKSLALRASTMPWAPDSTVFRAVLVITTVVCFSVGLSAQGSPATVGQWSSVFNIDYEPIHVMVLPTGKVLFWALQGASLNPQLWDPATGTVTPTPLPGYQVFCAGHSFLADDQILVTGGNLGDFVGVPNASLYDPSSNTWTRVSDMNAARWYPTNTTLSNGDVLVTSGEINTSAGVNTLPQVWQAAEQSWRDLTTAQLALGLYPRMFLAPNGKVFYATPDSPSRYLDTTGTGGWTPVANLNFDSRDYDTAVMYAPGKILTAGGADPPTATAEVIDLNAASPAWRYVGSMSTPRRQLNGTILADGKVLISGGSSGSGFDNASAAVYLTEMWDPGTEQFTPMASITKYRGYHSTAVLLPDGRVLSAGGDVSGATAEIFSPPYLFNGPRPTISSAPTMISYGQTFSVATADSGSIAQANLIRLSSVTHSFNQDQRINGLSFTIGSGTLNITAPANGNLAPPGPYMLFILNGNGVPSVAQIVQLVSDLPPKAVPTATPTSGPIPLSVTFSGTQSSDLDGTVVGYSWDFGDGQVSSEPGPSHTYSSPGTYTVTLTVTDNSGSTASRNLLITATVVHPPPPLVASLNPASGTQGAALSVAINGNDFQSGAACGFGPGITVSSCIFDSTTQLTAFMTISSNAPLGPHDVTVVNPDLQSSTLAGGFAVNPPPSVTSLTPSSGGQGQLITVIIKGSNFQNGAACSFGAGTTVNSCTFDSSSQLTAKVAIRATAILGPRDVTVTDPDNQSGTMKGGFTVTQVAISLIQTATFSLQPSSSGTVTLALPQPTRAGHTLIVGVSFWPLDVSSVTDGSGDTFTKGLPTPIYHGVPGSPTYNNFYYTYAAGGATSITLNFSGGSTYLLTAVAEVAGLDSAAPLDQAAYNESLTATQNWSSGAVTTSAANEYLFSWAATEASNPNCSAPGSGWTIETQTNDSGGATVCLLDQIVSARGPYQASVTASTGQDYAMDIATFVGGSAKKATPGDFDGDGKADDAVWRPSDGTWYILDSNNPGSVLVQQWGMNGDIPVRGDYDKDGKTDFAVFRPSSGQWFIIPSSNPGSPIVQQWGISGDIPVPGDYDGDGKTDFAVWRPSTGQFFIILTNNPGSPIVQVWGANGDMPVPGDYDGDGITDFAVWHPATGQFFVIPSGNPGTPIVQQWGTSGDLPVPGDYDGDGKTDFAVWRPSTGGWLIIPSSTPGSPIVQQWGTSGDIPVPIDYDGDGKTDIAVWRPSTGSWYVIPSSTPTTPIATQWGTNGDVPIQRPIGQ